ncbi:MAG: carboxypeptidase regulatory-like domain-containing protein [Bryobacteraceae bacterium]
MKIVVLFVLSTAAVWAQAITTSDITGVVHDPTGLAVPGADVRATQTDTGLVRSVTSAADGTYRLTNLPIGRYQLSVSKEGFSTFVQTGIVLQVNSNPEIIVQLKVGSVAEQVSVEASAAIVETQNTDVGSVVDNQRVVDLPLNGRNPQELLLLSGPAIQTTSLPIPAGRENPNTLGISVAGGNIYGILYELDGAEHTSAEAFLPLPIPFPDALQEFKLETSSTPARYGHHAAATVNMVTKSGTNGFHGDLFEFVRNGDFNARNDFAAKRDTLKRNQFGGVLGGPVIKNKLFFFFGYQDTIVRTDPGTTVTVIPTVAELAGNFTIAASAVCGKTVNLGAPFVNNQLPVSLLSPITQKIGSWFPASLNPNQCGQVTYGFPNADGENQTIAKVDWQLSDKHSMFFRFFRDHYNQVLPVPDATQNLLGATSGFDGQQYAAITGLVGDTYLLSPNIVSTFRASVQYIPNSNLEPTTAFPSALGVNANALSSTPFFGMNVSGAFSFGGAGQTDWKNNSGIGQIAEDFDITRGSHQIAFGVDYLRTQYAYTSPRLDNGEFVFSGQNSGLAMADFVAGLPNQFNQGYGALIYDRANGIALFAQDAWKIIPRLTLTLGVRWEPFLPPVAQQDYPYVEGFSMSNYLSGIGSKVYANAPPGMIFPSDSQWNYGLSNFAKHWNDFAPRVGLVFDPRGQGKEVIRAGYGILYDTATFGYIGQMPNNPPFGNTLSLNNPNMASPYANYPGGSPFPYVLNATAPFVNSGTYYLFSPNLPAPYVQQWNLSIQKQFGSDWSLTAAYIGSKSTDFWMNTELNPATYFPGASCLLNGITYSPCSSLANTQQRRLLSLLNPTAGKYYAGMITAVPDANASYNALNITAQKRFSRNVSVLAVYTWSHCIDNAEQTWFDASYDANNPYNIASNRGDCGQDVRQLFSSSFVFSTPRFSNSMLAKIAGNWQLSPIIRMNTGLPVNPLSGADDALDGMSSNTGATTQRPNVICSPGLTNPTPAEWFNRSCFVANGPGAYGTAGRDSLRAPGQVVANVAVSRSFAVHEKQVIQFRAEAFNLPNLVNLGAPTATLTSALFGKITTAGDPRILQFAMKYVF